MMGQEKVVLWIVFMALMMLTAHWAIWSSSSRVKKKLVERRVWLKRQSLRMKLRVSARSKSCF
jgi:hypothetical protein